MTSDNPFSHNHGSGKVPQMKGIYYSGQIIATSAEVTPKDSLVWESYQNLLISGLGIVVICPGYWRDPFFTSMIMGGRVFVVKPEGLAGLPKISATFLSEENVDASNQCIHSIWKACPFPRYK